MFFFRKRSAQTPVGIRQELRDVSLEQVLDQCLALINPTHPATELSLNMAQGLALGGERVAVQTTNDRLLEQAQALSLLSQRLVPLTLHVLDYGVGNNQTLRLPFFRFFASTPQESADFTLIAQRLAELSLQPIMVVHSPGVGEYVPLDMDLVQAYLGNAAQEISTPTPAQEMLFGAQRRRVLSLWNAQEPMTLGLTMPASLRNRQWAARQAFFTGHLQELLQQAMAEFKTLTGRFYDAASVAQPQAAHWVVTTEQNIQITDAPLVRVRYLTPELQIQLANHALTFVERNHARALQVALGLDGFSLVHYGPLDAEVIAQALALNEKNRHATAKARFRFAEPATPAEEIYNQRIAKFYPALATRAESPLATPHRPATGPQALERHPRHQGIPAADLHNFWNLNGKYFATGQAEQVICTPMLATGMLPAGSSRMLPYEHRESKARVLTAGQFLETAHACLVRENYAHAELGKHLRNLSQQLHNLLREGATLEQVLAQVEVPSEILKAWQNALHFAPLDDCRLESPFVEMGGIFVQEKSTDKELFLSLMPNTLPQFLKNPAHLLLDHDAEQSYVRKDHSPAEQIAHVLSAVAVRESRVRGERFQEWCGESLAALRRMVQTKLSISLSGDLESALSKIEEDGVTLAELALKMDKTQAPLDRKWLLQVHQLETKLDALCQQSATSFGWVSQGASGNYPWSPVMVPWAQSGQGGGVELALGLWEAQMVAVCQDFVAIRQARLEAEGRYQPKIHDPWFANFHWQLLTPEELQFCPPLLLIGNDQDFARQAHAVQDLFRRHIPLHVILLDTLAQHPAFALQQYQMHGLSVAQSSLQNLPHLVESFTSMLQSGQASLLQVLCPLRNDPQGLDAQAVEMGLYPLYRLNSTQGLCLEHPLGQPFQWAQIFAKLPRKTAHLRPLPQGGIPLLDWLQLDAEDRLEQVPTLDCWNEQGLERRAVDQSLVLALEEWQRTMNWLNSLLPQAPVKPSEDPLDMVMRNLMELARK